MNLERDLQDMREYYRSGKTKEASWRKLQLQRLKAFLKEKERDIYRALNQDLGKHHVEAFRDEIGVLQKSINFALQNLKEWMSSKKAKLPAVAVLSYAEIVPEPLGLVLIISSWNFPIGLSLEPLIGAIAAGNTVVLKPSELASASSSLLANALPTYIDSKAIKVIEGGPAVGEHLLQQKWDKIFFTGSTRVGRMVMSAAVKHLTPITLELGGKCPAIIDSLTSSWDKEVHIKKMLGENPRKSNSIARIINKHHFSRLKNLLNDPMVKDSIVYGGSVDEANLFIEPTVLVDPPLQAAIMTEEIFGPLLPIITLKRIEDSIDFINSRPKPLVIYAFTKNERLQRRMVSETSSGSIVFNDAVIQFVADTLPFGGIGESGIGSYHGKFSFDAFSHHKPVVRRSYLSEIWFRFPPWNNYKLQLFELVYNYDYLGMLLVILGLKRPRKVAI
ncbi:Aldehyde dehydrogenase family 3 member F1 [Citrus sinensis]|uniref:Aldehyde dehydrogenase family 3 member F1 n=1 Tax=Citrus sinensis TaxID=2711 RepID=A0ACB8MV52_CITSI|nr:Aldehyde dehydrogenase family 3 member F1 [Citrus sinensis]